MLGMFVKRCGYKGHERYVEDRYAGKTVEEDVSAL